MKLDPKVKENALIGHGFNSEKLKLYIGKECYFADALEDFINLTKTLKGVLESVSPDAEECYLVEFEINGISAEFSYAFCLPAEFVEEKPKEKKYRPYTIEEFCNEGFEIIVFRDKDDPSLEYNVRYNGYRKCDTVYKVILGNISYTLSDLFDNYEYRFRDEWRPFGVEVE